MPSKSRVLAFQFSRLGALLSFLILGTGSVMAAGGGGGPDEHHHEALPAGAEEVIRPLGIPITNSMVMLWAVAAVLILVAWLATRRMQLVPGRLQNFVEWLVESLINFFTGIMGERLARRTFWFLATAFILILFSNWAGLIPGVGTVGWELSGEGVKDDDQWRPFFRGANADLNLTMAMAMTFFLLWFYWSLTEIGPVNFIKHIFAPKGGKFRGIMLILMGGLFLFVGLIEVLSIAVRPIALMFRLYGNVFAGESMLEILMTMFPLPDWLQWLPALPFYFLELLVGFVQALVFALLCAVFTKLMCEHHDEEHDEEHSDEGHDQGEVPAEPNSAESSS